MKPSGLYPQASWLFGIIVGLALREGLIEVVPNITAGPDKHPSFWAMGLQVCRLIVFGVTLIRFFLGSVVYFDEVYGRTENCHYSTKNFGLDFLIGLVHFTLFFAWATAISDYEHRDPNGISHFMILAGFVLLYDIVWLIASWRYDTRYRIQLWTVINFLTVVFCVAVFAVMSAFGMADALKEEILMLIVVVLGYIDISEVIGGRSVFGRWLQRLLRLTPPKDTHLYVQSPEKSDAGN